MPVVLVYLVYKSTVSNQRHTFTSSQVSLIKYVLSFQSTEFNINTFKNAMKEAL